MPFESLTVTLDRELADVFGDGLMEVGALSVSIIDADEGSDTESPIYGEPGAVADLWAHCQLTALFSIEPDGTNRAVQSMWQVAASLGLDTLTYTHSRVEDLDWVQQNREQFQPIRISERITIVPTWHQATNAAADAINIALDPGAAFGTGSHPTTALCLEWLEQTVTAGASLTVLDYGTGSGILAIAAMKLGAASAHGVDIDPNAVATARFNADQNGCTIRFSTSERPIDDLADVTVANILANPLSVLAPLLARHTRPGGRLALAGILDDQAQDIIEIYRPFFELRVWKQRAGWSCIAGTRH